MNKYTITNILDAIKIVGEDEVINVLSDFSCPLNSEIENFVKKNAIDFANKKMSVTYLVTDDRGDLAAIFALTHKTIEISNEGLSMSSRKKISRYATLNENNNCYMISAFLIAQFGKNCMKREGEPLSGNCLMEYTMEILAMAQQLVGGGIVYLECEDKPKLLSFYQNEHNHFQIFNERFSESDGTKYIQLFRFF